jgi:hypothetical protein
MPHVLYDSFKSEGRVAGSDVVGAQAVATVHTNRISLARPISLN